MMGEDRTLSCKEIGDIKTLMKFVGIYCRENHEADKLRFSMRRLNVETIAAEEHLLCPDCTKLLRYGLSMRLKCPHSPKPMCKKCETQCYKGEYKEKIREIMKFSGMYLVKRGRIDLLYHYLR
jgi:hypothetical protein